MIKEIFLNIIRGFCIGFMILLVLIIISMIFPISRRRRPKDDFKDWPG